MGAIFTLSVEELRPGVRAIMVAGELDMVTAPTLQERVHQELAGGVHTLILHLDELTFLGSAGILVLVQAQKAAKRAHVPLRLVCNVHQVLRTLKICGVLDQFDISYSLGDVTG